MVTTIQWYVVLIPLPTFFSMTMTNSKASPTLDEIHEYIMERFNDVKNSKKISELIKFHTINKYLLMSHNTNQLKKLGRIIANHKELETESIIKEYSEELIKTFEYVPTIKSHTNTLSHIFGHFSKNISQEQKQQFVLDITKYQKQKITLTEILSSLKAWTSEYDKWYLVKQTYFLFFTESK